MTTKDIMKRIREKGKRNPKLTDLEELAEATFAMVKPTLDEAKTLTRMYNENPSIERGSRMEDARQAAKSAVEDAVTALTNIWECEYRNDIGMTDFAELLKRSMEKVLYPNEGEKKNTLWIRYPGLTINGGC